MDSQDSYYALSLPQALCRTALQEARLASWESMQLRGKQLTCKRMYAMQLTCKRMYAMPSDEGTRGARRRGMQVAKMTVRRVMTEMDALGYPIATASCWPT